MIEKSLALYLQSLGLGTFGTDLFVDELPDTPVQAVLIRSAEAIPPNQYVDTKKQMVEFWSRSPYSETAYNKLMNIYNVFDRNSNWETDNWHIYFSECLGQPVNIDRDQNSGKMYRLSILLTYRNLNTVS